MSTIKLLWNRRAKLMGSSFRSVMEQSFPPVVNKAIHDIHVTEIIRAMPESCKRVLDVGCGWGRIASDIVDRREVYVLGIDLSSHFVNLFNKRLRNHGHAVVGDMQSLPFKNNTFDVVYCVVSLMYLSSEKDQKIALREMIRVLKYEGRLVLIEPNKIGVGIVKLGGLVPFLYRVFLKKKKVETYGIAFDTTEIERLIKQGGGTILYSKGYPFFTFFLLPMVIVGKLISPIVQIIAKGTYFLDRLMPISNISYFVTWVVRK